MEGSRKLNGWQPAASNPAVDGICTEAYVAKAMRAQYSRFFILLTAAAAGTVSSFADDLDAALEAQKKKAQRRIYSERALLTEQNLAVPQTPTEEERNLDKKLQEIEAQLDRQQVAERPAFPVRPAVTVVPQPAENKNWLTAAVMDDTAAVELTNDAAGSWLKREMERRQELKAQEAEARDNELVDKILREKTQPQISSTELNRLQQYQLKTGKEAEENRASVQNPLELIRPGTRKDKASVPPLFSPEAARFSSFTEKNPLKNVKSPLQNPLSGSSIRTSKTVFSPYREEEPQAPSLTALEMIRKSSPINRADPFTEDPMPRIKTSIWE